MSSELQLYQLDELCEFINGFAFKSSDYVEPSAETVEVLRMGYICRGGGFKEDSTPVFVPRKYGRNLDKYFLKPGDVVIAMTDMKDKVAILANTAWISHADRFVLNQRVGCIRVKRPDLLNPRFFYFYSNSLPHVTYLRTRANSGVQVNLSTSAIKESMIQVPPLQDQLFIADLLGALDDRITLLRETNATLEAIAQALFKSWFVDFDPVRAKAEGLEPQAMDATTAALFPDSFEESELGLVPKGWKMSTLGAICDSNGGAIQTGPFGSQLHAADYVVEGVPVVMPKDISNRRVDASTAARVRLEDVQRLARHQLRDGDIVFSRRGDVEKHALIGETERGWLCGTGCLLVRPGTRRNVAGYLSRSLDLPQIKQWLTQHAVGATMPNLNTGILSAVPVVLPADEILAAFEQATNALDKRISAGNAAAKTLTQMRDTLLPRLISGQLRLSETEVLLEEAV